MKNLRLHLWDLQVQYCRLDCRLPSLVLLRPLAFVGLLLLGPVLGRDRESDMKFDTVEGDERKHTFNTFFDDIRPEISFEIGNMQSTLHLIVLTVFHHILNKDQ